MSKKILRSGAIGLVLAMALTACGSADISTQDKKQKENNELVTLRVWGAEEDQDLLNQLVEGFKQEYSNEASFEILVEVADEVKSKEVILSDVNNAPDIFTFADNDATLFQLPPRSTCFVPSEGPSGSVTGSLFAASASIAS